MLSQMRLTGQRAGTIAISYVRSPTTHNIGVGGRVRRAVNERLADSAACRSTTWKRAPRSSRNDRDLQLRGAHRPTEAVDEDVVRAWDDRPGMHDRRPG